MYEPGHTRHAFSLIELSIVLVLAGLLFAAAMQLMSIGNQAECYASTKSQTIAIKEAIERFALKNDRFPAPARRNVGINSTGYGQEAAATDIDVTAGIMFGAVPVITLGLNATDAADCWGNKFTYAVTEVLTDSTNFIIPTTDGEVDIKTKNGADMFLEGAGYAIISHGQDALGAVKMNYSTATNTPADRKWCAASTELRTQNCDAADADFIATEYNDGKDAAANFYDDIIVYRGKPWRLSPVDLCGNIAGDQGVMPAGMILFFDTSFPPPTGPYICMTPPPPYVGCSGQLQQYDTAYDTTPFGISPKQITFPNGTVDWGTTSPVYTTPPDPLQLLGFAVLQTPKIGSNPMYATNGTTKDDINGNPVTVHVSSALYHAEIASFAVSGTPPPSVNFMTHPNPANDINYGSQAFVNGTLNTPGNYPFTVTVNYTDWDDVSSSYVPCSKAAHWIVTVP